MIIRPQDNHIFYEIDRNGDLSGRQTLKDAIEVFNDGFVPPSWCPHCHHSIDTVEDICPNCNRWPTQQKEEPNTKDLITLSSGGVVVLERKENTFEIYVRANNGKKYPYSEDATSGNFKISRWPLSEETRIVSYAIAHAKLEEFNELAPWLEN
jgi:hypothetical protein